MGWQDDLGSLLSEFGGELGGGLQQDLGGQYGQAALGLLDLPLTATKYGAGAIMSGINEASGLAPWSPFKFDPAMSAAFHSGDWQDAPLRVFEANRAREYQQIPGPLNTVWQVGTELGLNPATYLAPPIWKLPGGAGTAWAGAFGEQALRATEAGRPGLALGFQGGEQVARATQFLYNDMYDQGLRFLGQTPPGRAVRAAGGAIVRRIPGINQLAPEFEHQRAFAPTANANYADRAKGHAILPMVGPMTKESGPPIVPSMHPEGSLPDRIYKGNVGGWFKSWVAKLGDGGPAGIVPGAREYAEPGRLGSIASTNEYGQAQSLPAMTEEDLKSLVDTSLAALQDSIDNSGTFGSVRTAFVHGPAWADQMVRDHGEGIQPILPHVWEEIRRQDLANGGQLNLPAAEFVALPRGGSPAASVKSTRLDDINAQLAANKITREHAMAELGKYALGDQQAVEAAAQHGAAVMQLGRIGGDRAAFRPGGQYFPRPGEVVPQAFRDDVLGQAGGGLVPHDLADALGMPLPYGSNRAAWEGYMQQQLGQMAPDELETLAEISIQQYYEGMVNAANDYALGGKAFARGVEKAPRGRGRKTSVYAAGPAERGSPESQGILSGIQTFTNRDYGGRIMERDAWTEQLRQARGQQAPITRADLNEILGEQVTDPSFTGQEVKRALQTLEITPMAKNQVGGLLPNMEELLRWYQDGMDLRVGTALTRDHFERAAREMANLVGLGNHREFRILATFMGLGSGGTHVEDGVRLGMKAFAEYMLGHDETLRQAFQLDGPEVTRMIAGAAEETPDRAGKLAGLFQVAADGRVPLPNGPKEGNFAASFLVPHMRDQLEQITRALPPAVAEQARKDFDAALSIFTVDRHISRVHNGTTAVEALQHGVIRAAHVIAARKAGISPEEAQAVTWFLSKHRQGHQVITFPEGDVAQAMQKVIGELVAQGDVNPATWQNAVARMQASTGKDGPELFQEMVQGGQQVLFHRVLGGVLQDPAVARRLRGTTLPGSVDELGGDVLGFAARGAHGLLPREWPHPLGGSVELGQQIEALAANPPPTPTIFNFKDGSWQPVMGGGYGVPILDGGTFTAGQVQTARKRFEELVTKGIVGQVFDPVAGDRTKQLGIGVVPDGARYRLNLYALTADPTVAEAGAARAGARHIVDLTGQTMTPTKVTGRRQASLPRLLEEMFGAAPPTIDPTREQARKRGITMFEMDRRNPISIFTRKILNPLMDAYERLTKSEGPQNIHRTLDDLGLAQHPTGELESRGYDWQISANDNAALLRKTNRGLTHREIIAKGSREGGAAQKAFQEAGVSWKPWANIDERRQAVASNPELLKLVNKWHRLGIDPLYAAHPDDIGLALLEREMRKDAGLKVGRSTVPQLLAAAFGEQTLTTGRYLTGNVVGNWIMMALAGHAMPLAPTQYLAALKMLRSGVDDVAKADAMRSLKGYEIWRSYGLDHLPYETMRGATSEVSSNAARYSPSPTGELVGRLTRSQTLARFTGAPFILIKDMAQAADVVARSALLGDVLDREMQAMLPSWEATVRQAGAAIPGFEFSIADSINVPAGGLHTGPLYRKLQEIGLQPGVAERLVRDYTNLRAKGTATAIKEMNRVLFSFEKTKADVFLSKFVPFHYWQSRALRYYAEEAVRHPFLVVAYMRSNEGIEEAQNDPGLSARQKGYLGLFGTPLGFTLLMNPDALLGVNKIFSMQDSYETDGQTSLGGAMEWLRNHGLGLYPWLDGALNLMGMYGNTFEPDLMGIRHKAIAGAVINFTRAHLGFEPAGAPYADAMGQLRYATSSFVDSFTPDWLTKTVTPRAGGSYQEAALDTLIENVILDQNPQMTNQQLLEIMVDPDSELYKAAFRTVSEAGLAQELLNVTMPVSFRMKYDARDVRLAQMSTITEAAQAAGVQAYEFAPTPEDLAFRAKYKAQTGKDWQPTDYESAKFKNDLARAPIANKEFIVDEKTYYDLGTTKQQGALNKYYALLFGTDPATAGVADQSARQELANRWADAHRSRGRMVQELQAQRQTFATAHPQFAEFQDWSRRVRALAAQYGGSLAEYRRRISAANPNAARYFAEQEAFIRSRYPPEEWAAQLDAVTVSAAAFQTITGRGSSNRTSPGGATSRYEQGPYPGVPSTDTALPLMEPAPQPTTDWRSQAQIIMGY